MARTMRRSTRVGLITALAAVWAAIFATGPATAAIEGDWTIPVPNSPYLSFAYSDDISRTPESLNRTYVLTQVRNVVVTATGSTNTDAFSKIGPSASCTDPDVNLALGLEVARNSRFLMKVVYDQWDEASRSWLTGKELPLVDVGRGDPGTIQLPICGDMIPNPL